MKKLNSLQRISSPPFGVAFLLAAVVSVFVLTDKAQAQTFALNSLFTEVTGNGALIGSSTAPRGMTYDSFSNLVYISANASPYLSAFNGSNGTYLGNFTTTGLTGGTYLIDQVGAAADGAIYAINLATASSSPNKIYRWASWNAASFTTSYNGNALSNGTSLSYTSGRIGDTMQVTGSGANTLILCGVGAKPYFVLFSTVDGTNFTPTIINVSSGLPNNPNIFGLCFYNNNSFLVKSASSGNDTLYQVQYPANFASQTVVTGTVLNSTTTLGGSYNNTTMLAYNAGSNWLAAVQTGNNPMPVGFFGAASIASGLSTLATASPAASYNGGNNTGGAALGLGAHGPTNVLYAWDSGNALIAYSIVTIPPVAPTITTPPAGGSVYLSDTLSVAASGTTPFTYQWQASTSNSATGTFTNIPGATTNSLAITGVTNYYQVIVSNIVGSVTSTPVQVTILQPVVNAAVTNLWRIAAGQSGYGFLSTSDGYERGIAYDTNTSNVVVATTSALYILNGNTGASNAMMNTNGLTFGGLLPNAGIDQVGIADDGAVYAANVNTGPASLYINRWSAPTNTATGTQAYVGNPGGGTDRWGDSMAVRGAGANTQIAFGSFNSADIAIFTTPDGLNYTPQVITVSGLSSEFTAGGGLAFGAGNTLWGKTLGGDLYEISFNLTTSTATVVFDYAKSTQVPYYMVGVGIDPVNNIMAGINLGDTPEDLQLFQLTGTSDAPVLFDQAFFASANSNPNGSGVVTVKYPHIYALDANNGIVAVTYGVPATTPVSIVTPPASATDYVGAGSVTFTVSATGSLPIYYQWRFNSNNIPGATNSTYTLANTVATNAGYYDVVVHNLANSVTSTPEALLTLVTPVTNVVVTPLWKISPGTNSSVNGPYLTTSGYETRGLAYDPTSSPSNLLVADHYTIHVFTATSGAYQSDITTGGFPTGGINGWTVDQIGVADDGILYSANLSADGTAFSIASYGAYPYGSPGPAYGGNSGGSDLNTLDPTPDRWGDTMAIRGAGTNTQILLGSYNGTNVALFTTADGANFTPTLIAVQGGVPLGFASLGIAFGPGNTFYAKGGHFYDLRQVSFTPPVAGTETTITGTVIEDYNAPLQIPNDLTGLGVDVTNNILGGVCYNDAPHDLQLYLLSGNANTPSLFEQDFFPAFNANGQENAVVTLKNGLGFALDVNNGIVAFSYSEPAAPAVQISGVVNAPDNVTLNWTNNFANQGYQVQYKTNLSAASWINLGSPVTNSAVNGSYNDTTITGSTRFYRVQSE